MFPALDAKAAGFKVYAVIRRFGRPERIGIANYACSLHPGRWHPYVDQCRPVRDSPHVAPNYAAVMESYQKAQDWARSRVASRMRTPGGTAITPSPAPPPTATLERPPRTLLPALHLQSKLFRGFANPSRLAVFRKRSRLPYPACTSDRCIPEHNRSMGWAGLLIP
jgi:hypothetical protein